MSRTVDPARYTARRDAILDAAEQLVGEVGYDAMTIHEVLIRTGISKGALYHYFDSKAALLGGLIARRLDGWTRVVHEAARDGDAPTRLRAVARALAIAKAADHDLLVEALPALYADQNALLYLRIRRQAADRFLPVLAQIVGDGIEAGLFAAASAEGTARVVLSLLQECADVTAQHLLAISRGQEQGATVAQAAAAYVRALHDVLGASPGSLDFLEVADLDGWVRAARHRADLGTSDEQANGAPATAAPA